MLFLLIMAIFLYVGGYRLDSVRADVAVPKYFRKNIRPPKFIFLICASPKSKKYPTGVMLTAGLASQLLGIGFAIDAFVFHTNPETMIQIVVEIVYLSIILAASYFIPYWLSQKYPYNE
jgi:hypothetical protein